jgi:NADH dehydrogenase
MAVVGKNYAVLERGSFRMSGFLTFLVWAFIHILSLPQLQSGGFNLRLELMLLASDRC